MQLLVLGPPQGWHVDALRAAASAAGFTLRIASYESVSTSDAEPIVTTESGPIAATQFDAVIVRTMPAGSLEQVTFRLAVLHHLVASGIRVINPPQSLELAIDKHATSAFFHRQGVPTPRWSTSQSVAAAMEQFERLGGDCVIKPLFGGEGAGIVRVSDPALAWRTFRAIELHGSVIYQQEFVPPGGRDLRVLFVAERLAAVRRENHHDWRTNVGRGAQTHAAPLPDDLAELAHRLFTAAGLCYGALDFCLDANGKAWALELNAVPGWRGAQPFVPFNIAEAILAAAARSHPQPTLQHP